MAETWFTNLKALDAHIATLQKTRAQGMPQAAVWGRANFWNALRAIFRLWEGLCQKQHSTPQVHSRRAFLFPEYTTEDPSQEFDAKCNQIAPGLSELHATP